MAENAVAKRLGYSCWILGRLFIFGRAGVGSVA